MSHQQVLRCPMCGDPLAGPPQVACRVCETPAHTECWEYVGGCSRFACPEAATSRTRVLEYVATRIRQAERLARGIGWTAAAWTAVNGAIGVWFLVRNGQVNGFALATAGLLWIVGIRGLSGDVMWAAGVVGFVGSALLAYYQLARASQLARLRTRFNVASLTTDDQVALLRAFAPERDDPPVARVVGPLAQVAGAVLIAAAAWLVVTYLRMRHLPTSQFMTGALPLAALGLLIVGAAIIGLGRMLVGSQLERRRAIRLATLWREELDTMLGDAQLSTQLGEKRIAVDVAKAGSPTDRSQPTLSDGKPAPSAERKDAAADGVCVPAAARLLEDDRARLLRRVVAIGTVLVLALVIPFAHRQHRLRELQALNQSALQQAARNRQTPDVEQRDLFEHQVLMHFKAGRFDELDRVSDAIRAERSRFPGGDPKLPAFYHAIVDECVDRPAEVKGMAYDAWVKSHATPLDRWIADRPASTSARVARVELMVKGMFQIPEMPITPDQRKALIADVRRTVWDVAEFLGRDHRCPHLYTVLLQLYGAEDPERREKAWGRALACDPDFTPNYQERARSFFPEQGGKPGEWVTFLEEAARGRPYLYARLVYDRMPVDTMDLFTVLRPSWELARKGFEDHEARFPGGLENLHRYCMTAYVARDWATAAALFDRLAGKPPSKIWGWGTGYAFDRIRNEVALHLRQPEAR